MLQDHLDAGNKLQRKKIYRKTHGRESFRANDFYSTLGDWELQFVSTPDKVRTPITQGDEVETATRLYKKVCSSCYRVFIRMKSRQMRFMKVTSLRILGE